MNNKTSKIAKISIIGCLTILVTIAICGFSFGWFQHEITEPIDAGTIKLGSIDLSLEGYEIQEIEGVSKSKMLVLETTDPLIYDAVSNGDPATFDTMFNDNGLLPGTERKLYFSVTNVGNLEAEFITTFFSNIDNDTAYLNNFWFEITYLPNIDNQTDLDSYIVSPTPITNPLQWTGGVDELTSSVTIGSLVEDPTWDPATHPSNEQFVRFMDVLQPVSGTGSEAVYDKRFFEFKYGLNGNVGDSLDSQYHGRELSIFLNIFGTQKGIAYGENTGGGYVHDFDGTTSLQELIKRALPGDTIELIDNVEIDGDLSINRLINIVTNGYTLTVHGNIIYDFIAKGSINLDVRNGGKVICDNDFNINTPRTNIQIVGDGTVLNQLIVKGKFSANTYLDNVEPIKTNMPDSYDWGLYLNQINTSRGDVSNTPIDVNMNNQSRVVIGRNTIINTLYSEIGASNIEILNYGIIKQIDLSSMHMSPYAAKYQIYIWNNGLIQGINNKDNILLPYASHPKYPTENPSIPYLPNYDASGVNIKSYGGNTYIEKGINSNEIFIKDNEATDNTIYGFLTRDIIDPYEFVYVRKTNPNDSENHEYDIHFKHVRYNNDPSEEYLTLQEAWENSLYATDEPTKLNIICSPNVYFNNSNITNTNIQTDFTYLKNNFPYLEALNLTYAHIQDNTIPANAMSGCATLKEVTFPANLEVIKYGAFAGTSIEEVTLPNTMRVLEDDAFTSVTYAHIDTHSVLGNVYEGFGGNPDIYLFVANVNNYLQLLEDYRTAYPLINTRVFRAASRDASGLYYVSLDGNYYEIVVYIGENDPLLNLEIPERITCNNHTAYVYSCGQYSFYQSYAIKTINRSEIKYIKKYAFYETPNLTNVIIPNVVKIDESAFYNESAIEKLDITKVAEIGKSAFNGCTQLPTTIYINYATMIGESAFNGCAFTTLYANALERVDDNAFTNNTALREIHLGQLTYKGNTIFNGCSNLQFIFVDKEYASTDEIATSSFGTNANWGSKHGKLRRVYVPTNSHAVYASSTNYTFGIVTVFESGTLSPVYTAQGIDIGRYEYTFNKIDENNVKIVSYNENIASNINIPNKVFMNFGDGGKEYNIKEIGNRCYDNRNFTITIIPSSANFSLTIPDSITTIGERAFSENPRLTQISGGYNVESVGQSAFYNCPLTGTLDFYRVKTISPSAFYGHKFDSVYLYSIETIGDSGFAITTSKTMEELHLGNLTSYGTNAFSINNQNVTLTIKKLFLYNEPKNNNNEIINIENTMTRGSLGYFNPVVYNLFVPETVYDQYQNGLAITRWNTSINRVIPYNGLVRDENQNVRFDVNNVRFNDYGYSFGYANNAQSQLVEERSEYLYQQLNNTSAEITARIYDTTKAIGTTLAIPSGVNLKTPSSPSITTLNVTSIGPFAFIGKSNIATTTTLALPNTITNIGDSAFRGIKTIIGITGGTNVITYGANSFMECTGIATAIPFNNAITIGDSAFHGCTGISVALNLGSVETIGENAFYGCTLLPTLNGGYHVKTVGYQAFRGCSALTGNLNMHEAETIGKYAFYNIRFENIYLYSVKYIGEYAFARIYSVGHTFDSVHLGNTNYYGNYIFKYQTIKRLYLYREQADLIGNTNYETYYSTDVTIYNIFVPETMYGQYTADTQSTLRFNIQNIRVIPFNRLKSVNGENVAFHEDNYYFEHNQNLRDKEGYVLKKLNNNDVEIVSNQYYSDKYIPKDFIIPKKVIIKNPVTSVDETFNVTSIGQRAFTPTNYISAETRLTLPETLTNIGSSAFDNNKRIVEIIGGYNVLTIGERAFYNDTQTRDVSTHLQGSLNFYNAETIGDYAFYCSYFDNIYLYSAKTIGNYAFWGGHNYYGPSYSIKEIHLGQVTSYGTNAFSNNSNYGYGVHIEKLFLYNEDLTLADSVSIGVDIFKKPIDKLFVPASVIDQYMNSPVVRFGVDTSKIYPYRTIESVVGQKVTFSEDYVLSMNDDTKGIAHADYLLKIDNAVNKKASIQACLLSTVNSNYEINIEGIKANVNGIESYYKINKILTNAYRSTTFPENTTMTLPSTINYIDESVFADRKTIIKLNYSPSSATTIGNNAFSGCINMVYELNYNSLIAIGTNAFKNCNKITSVTIRGDLDTFTNDLVTISTSAFTGCTSLQTVDLTNVNTIGTSAFIGCASLQTVDLTNVDTVGTSAFIGCTSLQTVDLTNVNTIGTSAFTGCTSLQTVDLTNVNTIGTSAFIGCASLQTVDLTNVDTVGTSAFAKITTNFTLSLNNVLNIGELAFSESVFNVSPSLILNENNTIGTSAFKLANITGNIAINNLTTISAYAFNNANIIGTLSISNVDTIAEYAFSGIKGVTLTTIDNVGLIKEYGFADIASKLNMHISNTNTFSANSFTSSVINLTEPWIINVTTNIPTNAFLKTQFSGGQINIVGANPNTATIETEAFYLAVMNNNLTIKNIGTIGNKAFAGITGSCELKIENVVNLGEETFSGSDAITSLDIKGVANIPTKVFTKCANLKSVIARDIEIIGERAFESCTSIETLEIHGNSTKTTNTIITYAFNASKCTTIKLYDIYNIKTRAFLATDTVDLTINNSQNVATSIIETQGFARRVNATIQRIEIKNIYTIAVNAFAAHYKDLNAVINSDATVVRYIDLCNVYDFSDTSIAQSRVKEYVKIDFTNSNDVLTGIDSLITNALEESIVLVSLEKLQYYREKAEGTNANKIFPIAYNVGEQPKQYSSDNTLISNNHDTYMRPNYIIDADDTKKFVTLYRCLLTGQKGDLYIPEFTKVGDGVYEAVNYGNPDYATNSTYKVKTIGDYAYYNFSCYGYDYDNVYINKECTKIGNAAFARIKANRLYIETDEAVELGSSLFVTPGKRLYLVKVGEIKSLTSTTFLANSGNGVATIVINSSGTAFASLPVGSIPINQVVYSGYDSRTLWLVNSSCINAVNNALLGSTKYSAGYQHIYIDEVIQNGIRVDVLYGIDILNETDRTAIIKGVVPLGIMPQNNVDLIEQFTVNSKTYNLTTLGTLATLSVRCGVRSAGTLTTLRMNAFSYNLVTSVYLADVVTITNGAGMFAGSNMLKYIGLPKLTSLSGNHVFNSKSITELYLPSLTTINESQTFRGAKGVIKLTLGNVTVNNDRTFFGTHTDAMKIATFVTQATNPAVFDTTSFNNATLYVPYSAIAAYQARFPSCTVLSFENVYSENGIPQFMWDYYEDGIEIVRYLGTDSNPVIPSTLTINSIVYDVLNIKDNAFDDSLVNLGAITIPSQTNVTGKAFVNTSITSIIVDGMRVGVGLDYEQAIDIPLSVARKYYSYNGALYSITNGVSTLVYCPTMGVENTHVVEPTTKYIDKYAINITSTSMLTTLDLSELNTSVGFADNAITSSTQSFTILVNDTQINSYMNSANAKDYLKYISSANYIRVIIDATIHNRKFQTVVFYDNTAGNCTFAKIKPLITYDTSVIFAWYTDSTYNNEWLDTTIISSNITIYGKTN